MFNWPSFQVILWTISFDELELAEHRFSNDKQLSDRDFTIIEYAITFLVDHFRSDQVLDNDYHPD